MGTIPPPAGRRIVAVDSMRAISIFFVVCYHTAPFTPIRLTGSGSGWYAACALISILARFAVPFNFSLSGYFGGMRIRNGATVRAATLHMFHRVAPVFIAWALFYWITSRLIELFSILRNPSSAASHRPLKILLRLPTELLGRGSAYHLWFLPALICALLVAAFILSQRKPRLLLPATILLFVVGVLGGAYARTPFGFDSRIAGHTFIKVEGPFISSLFFATGYMLSQRKPRPEWAHWGVALMAAGFLLYSAEIGLIHKGLFAPQLTFFRHEFVFGTYPLGFGSLLLALAQPGWLASPMLARWGRMALGIYCVHLFFVQRLEAIVASFNSPISEALFPCVVFFLALATVSLGARWELTRRFCQ